MRKISQAIALTLAALAAANAVATDDFRVVVPLYGKKAVDAGIALLVSDLPPATVGEAYAGFDFKSVLQVTSSKSVDLASVTWSAVSPLPAGMSLSASGMLTGTPSAAAVTSGPFTVAATYQGKTAVQVYQLPVTAAEEAIDPDEPYVGPSTGGTETVSDGDAILTVAPTKLSFGLVARQLPTAPMKVAIRNTGTKAGAVAIDQPSSPEYTVTHNCPTPLEAGDACEVSVVFTPKTQNIVKSTFKVSLAKQGITVALDGTGRNSTATFTHLPAKASIQDFGIVASGQIVARQTVIKNTSKYYALALFNVGMIPSYRDSAQFRIENDECPKILQVGESCTITPVFAPTAQGSYSSYAKIVMNVSGDYGSFYMYGRSAGDLAITSLSRAGAMLAGGYEMSVNGTGILPGAKVYFGETPAVTRNGSTTYIYTTVPAVSEPESTYVRIVNPDGTEASSPKPFIRARSFAAFSVKGPLVYGKQALNVPSPWQAFALRNNSYFPNEPYTISDIRVSGPYQVDTSSGYCAPGKVLGYGGGGCTLRVRFVPTEAGDAPGELTVQGNDDALSLAMTGIGLAWEGTPSGSASSNTDLPYSTVLSGNEVVGGAPQTKFVDIYLRNTNPNAQLNAYFSLTDGSAFKLYTINKSSNTGSLSSIGCLSASTPKDSLLCRADVGSGTYPHIMVRLKATSASEVGTHYEELVVRNSSGEEQYRIPLWLDVVYDVWMQPYAEYQLKTPLSDVSLDRVQLAQESFKDVWLANVGTTGMMRTDSISLVNKSSEDLYLKSDSVALSTQTGAGVGTCGKLVSADEHTGCLSDDVNGGYYKNQRVRVYFKPMTSGLRTATLRVTHRGQGDNPLDLAVAIKPVELNAVFSGNTAAAEVADVPTTRISANYEVDQSNTLTQFKFFLNSTDDSPMKGYFVLSGAGTEKTDYSYAVVPVSDTGAVGSGCSMQSQTKTALCATSATYQNFRFLFSIYSKMGAGTYNWTLTFYDPAMNEVASVPLVIELLNDNQPEISQDWRSSVPLPTGTLDFGTLTVATAPKQPVQSADQRIYIRNLGQFGKMKIERAYIEGGDGAFTMTSGLYLALKNATTLTTNSCTKNSVKLDSYTVSSCIAGDAANANANYTVVVVPVTFKPLANGPVAANLVIWHDSALAPNPLVVPLAGEGAGTRVEGELSGTPDVTSEPNGDFGTYPSSVNKTVSFYVRNPGPFGAVYGEIATLEGSPYFTFYGTFKAGSTTPVYTSCAPTYGPGNFSSSGCLADTYNTTGVYKNLRYVVRCLVPSSAPVGTYTATLRITTQGKEHVVPLSCSKS